MKHILKPSENYKNESSPWFHAPPSDSRAGSDTAGSHRWFRPLSSFCWSWLGPCRNVWGSLGSLPLSSGCLLNRYLRMKIKTVLMESYVSLTLAGFLINSADSKWKLFFLSQVFNTWLVVDSVSHCRRLTKERHTGWVYWLEFNQVFLKMVLAQLHSVFQDPPFSLWYCLLEEEECHKLSSDHQFSKWFKYMSKQKKHLMFLNCHKGHNQGQTSLKT